MSHLSSAPPLEAAPPEAGAYTQQAIAHAIQGRLEEAVTCIQLALRLQPDSANAHYILGNILFYQARYEDAVASYQQALCHYPYFAEVHSNLGNTLSTLKRYEEAVTHCQQALRLQPNYAKGYVNLGNANGGLGRPDAAMACYRQALKLDPDIAEAHYNLGAALAALDKLDEAVASYQEAVRLKPDFADAYYNLGVVFTQQQNWDAAAAALRQAVRLQPNHAEAHYRLGGALGEQAKLEEARSCFQRALQLKPDYADAHWALAYSWLLAGDFERAWPDYEWRQRLKEMSLRPFPQPTWDGSALAGRTILLHAEQGFGDTVQFIRYTALVKQFGGTVIVECQKPLLPLLESCPGIDRLVAAGSELPAFDLQAPLLSLPRILKTTLATVPSDIPYLAANAELLGKWQRQLSRRPGFKIGIAWQGNPRYSRDHQRSLPLIHFARLASLKGVCLISLQKGPGTEQLHDLGDHFRVIDLGSQLDKESGAFMDTAAVMKNLDLVIAPDTAIAHLAGALGVPVWLALSFVPDWRWLLQREDSPWYPSMRLFRQSRPGDWEGVFDRMAQELSGRLATSLRSGTVLIEIAAGELIDKVTILEIKSEQIRDPAKLRNVHAELQSLQAVRAREIGPSEEIALLTSELKTVNRRLWQVEDEIRQCERANDFGPRFIELARAVYQQNDRRAALKRRINERLGSRIVEEKSYAGCAQTCL